jgi:hypothetical protein
MQTLVTLCWGIFFLLTLAAAVGPPKCVVPNFPDIAIKTRHTSDGGPSQLRMLYLKGSRQRVEIVVEKPSRTEAINLTVIRQCDQERLLVLNERDKIYNSSEIVDRSEWLTKARSVTATQPSGVEVTMIIDSVDTGERRKFEHSAARHVRVKIRFESNADASTPASVEETDGWYIDLPGFGCQDQPSSGFARLSVSSGNRRDRLQVKWLGKAPRGYPIEETSVKTDGENTTTRKVELLEISETPLIASVFDMPAGYKQALQTGNGGADLTKPDSIANRTRYYWTTLILWVSGVFR